MIKVIIADDEKHALSRLKELLSIHKDILIIGEAKSGDEALSLIISKKPDAAFLDINMPGTSVFSSLPALKDPPQIIFQTAYSEYAVDAFGINALDYLLKPVSSGKLVKALQKLRKYLSTSNESGTPKKSFESLSVKTLEGIKIIKVSEINRITFEEGFSFIYTNEGRFLSDRYLSYFEEVLAEKNFYRVNRNDLLNLSKVKLIHPSFKGAYEAELSNKETVKISRRRVAGLKKMIDF